MKIELSPQALALLRRLPPEPRGRIRRALRALANDSGDIKALEEPLDGYCRLRVGNYRVILAYSGRRTVQCVLIEQRSVVYELFASELEALLTTRRRRS